MSEKKKVHVRLKARCYVDKEIYEANTVVEMDADIAPHFGEVLGDDKKKPESKPKGSK